MAPSSETCQEVDMQYSNQNFMISLYKINPADLCNGDELRLLSGTTSNSAYLCLTSRCKRLTTVFISNMKNKFTALRRTHLRKSDVEA
jgi:hypothetical protein